MACANVNSPALTKLTTMMVVAVEDWMAAVTPTPVTRRLNALDVMDARKDLSPSPATFWSPTLSKLSPKRNNVTDPMRVTNWNIICIYSAA